MLNILLIALLGSCVDAAPIPLRRQNGDNGFQPKDLEGWKSIVNIDSNCGLNQPEIVAALNGAYTLADKAKNVSSDDYMFNLFFLPQDVTPVQKLFSTIVQSASSPSKQYKISCLSAYATECGTNTTIAVTDRAPTNGTNLPEIRLCPPALHLTPSPSHDQQTLGHIILAELTHFDYLARPAGLPTDSLNQTSGIAQNGTAESRFQTDVVSAGTYDVWTQNMPDENNASKTYRDFGNSTSNDLGKLFAAAAGCLKSRWDAYNQAANGSSSEPSLNEPPIQTLKNAGSYSSFAILFSDEQGAGGGSQQQLRSAALALVNGRKC